MSFRRHPKRVFCLGAVVLGLMTILFCGALLAQPFSLTSLIQKSDVIVVGAVRTVHQTGTTEVRVGAERLSATNFQAEVQVDRILKGACPESLAIVRFLIPKSAGFVGYTGVGAPSYRTLFLRKVENYFVFADPAFPSLPGVSHVGLPAFSDVISGVINELSQVLASQKTTEMDKLEAIFGVQSVPAPDATKVLRAQLDGSPAVRAAAIAALIERNDLSALVAAQELLMNPPPQTPNYLLNNIASAIARGIRDEGAIPVLNTLLRSRDIATRRAASDALRKTGSTRALSALAKALNDSDSEVRYYAVIGLAEITNQPEWRPLMDDFKAHENKFLQRVSKIPPERDPEAG